MIVDILAKRALKHPEKTAYIILDGHGNEMDVCSYEDLIQSASQVSNILNNRNEQFVVLLFETGIPFISSLFGVFYAGKTAVPIQIPTKRQGLIKLQNIIADLGNIVILTTDDIFKKLHKWFPNDSAFHNAKWKVYQVDGSRSRQLLPIKKNDLAIIQYTSGSTSSPKGVMISHDNLIHNLEFIKFSFQLDKDTVGVSWLPHYHDMGLVDGILSAVFNGHTKILIPPLNFIKRPYLWLYAMSKYQAHYTGAPNFSFDLCVSKIQNPEDLDLRQAKVFYNAAEPIHYKTIVDFYNRFKFCGVRMDQLGSCYGLAENTLAVTMSRVGKKISALGIEEKLYAKKIIKISPTSSIVKVSSGFPYPESKVKIVDTKDKRICDDLEIGEVWVYSKSNASGYWNLPSAQLFSEIDQSGEKYLITGDEGFMYKNELFITGRIKDLIIYHGNNYYPEDFEDIIKVEPEVTGMGCVAFSFESDKEEKIVLLTEIDRNWMKNFDPEDLMQRILRSIFQKIGIPIFKIIFVYPWSLPRTSSGKIQRNQCKSLYKSNQLKLIKNNVGSSEE